MSITLQLDLPDALADEARAKGLLEPASLSDLLTTELRRRRSAAELRQVLDDIRAQPGVPMSEEDVANEVKRVRQERRAREAGH
jgi:hypothetical protein